MWTGSVMIGVSHRKREIKRERKWKGNKDAQEVFGKVNECRNGGGARLKPRETGKNEL
jgi:hypothetical protein